MATEVNMFTEIENAILKKDISEPTLINIAANLYTITKTTASDRQWFTKNVAQNKEFLDMNKTFVQHVLIPEVQEVPGLNGLDLSQSMSTIINTHHKMLRDALQIYLLSLFTKAKDFSYNFDTSKLVDFKRVIFYLAHSLEIEATDQRLISLLQEINSNMSQMLYFTTVTLLVNPDSMKKCTRLDLEWMASRLAEKETAQAIEFTIGAWTRRLLINALLLKASEMPIHEPTTDDEKSMAKELLFVPNKPSEQPQQQVANS